jgi:ubiquinone/menaquinone biosynthesis C-methylase UbiE
MPAMSRFEAGFCRSSPWRGFARRIVLPWALQGHEPVGRVLEIGAGSGAMAAGVLATHPRATVVATDVDRAMVDRAARLLARFGGRGEARQADAAALPFEDGSFDVVLSWLMLHHTVRWEQSLAEVVRVLRPGGHVLAYDLLPTLPLRLLHHHEGGEVRMLTFDRLRRELETLPVDRAVLTSGLGGFVGRFALRKAA